MGTLFGFVLFNPTDKDPLIKALCTIISQHWPVKKKLKYMGGDEEQEESLQAAVVDDSQELDPPSFVESSGDVDLAAALGVQPWAPAVQPCPDSQVPPDTFDYEIPSPAAEEVAAEEGRTEESNVLTVFPGDLDEPTSPSHVTTELDQTPSMTPTEIEETPPNDVIEIRESPKRFATVVTDPLPNAASYTPSDLKCLREKIAQMKFLPLCFINFFGL